MQKRRHLVNAHFTRFFFVSCFRVWERSAVLGNRRNANGEEEREEIETGESLLHVVF